jgi:uncharacterized damage-inducible protein DinB
MKGTDNLDASASVDARVAAASNLLAAKASVTAEERTHAVQQLKDSEQEFLASIEKVSEAQWNWKPAPGRWSVGQTAEHIMQSEVVLFRRIQHAIQSPANPDWGTQTADKTELIERVIPDRSRKATAPETTKPQGLSKQEVVRRFKELRAQIIEFAMETQIALKEHTANHPFPSFGTLNTYQWLLLVPLHSRRHDHQIAEIKGTSGYPE